MSNSQVITFKLSLILLLSWLACLSSSQNNNKYDQFTQQLGAIFKSMIDNNGYQLPDFGLFEKCNYTEQGNDYIFFAPIPLTKIKVKAELFSTLLTYQLSQYYQNIEDVPIEVQYVFPVHYKSVIYNLTIETSDGRIIIAKVKETKKAQQEYEEAIAQGNTAYLASYDSDQAQDKVVLKIGNLQPHVNVIVHFQLAMAVEPTIDSFWRIMLPAALTPKFPTELVLQTAKDLNLQAATDFPIQSDVPYNIDYTMNISSASQISQISSPSHDIVIEYSQDRLQAFITLDQKVRYIPDRDFVILFSNNDQNTPRVLIAKEEGNYFSTMVSFYPYINQDTNSNFAEQEFILIIDRSGSMEGDRIELAKKTAIEFVKKLPQKSYFNIIGFGSSYELMWKTSKQKTEDTENEAKRNIQNFQADLGGTEILEPLKEVYSWQESDFPRTLFLITDGAVSNPDLVIKLIQQNTDSQGIRVITFGIGEGVSTELVQGAADAGKGVAYFVQGNEPLDQYMLEALDASMVPYLDNIDLKWRLTSTDGQQYGTDYQNKTQKFMQSPSQLKFIISKQLAVVYGLILDISFDKGELYFSYFYKEQKVESVIPLNSSQLLQTNALSKLAAKSMIKDLNINQDENAEFIIYLSEKFNILSPLTSFIAVQLVENPSNNTMQTVEVPIPQTSDSQGSSQDDSAYYTSTATSRSQSKELTFQCWVLLLLLCLLPRLSNLLKDLQRD